MTAVAPTLQALFTDRLANQKRASPHTIGAYRDTFRLLLAFAQDQNGKPPSSLDFDDLDAVMVGAFLDHLEQQRHNSVRTGNARLAAIHSLFRYAALAHPEHAAVIARVLAIPTKRFERVDVSFLYTAEIDALLAAPDRARWVGRRDHALLVVAVQTGLRVSELVALRGADINLGRGATSNASGRDGNNEPPHSPPTPSKCSTSGYKNGPRRPNSPCSRPAEAARSAPTPSPSSSPNTRSPPPGHARHWRSRPSRPMYFDTRRP